MTSLAEKTSLIRQYSQEYYLDRWFIGTGGSTGEDIWNLRTDFDRLISINPDYDDYVGSQLRFLDSPHVIIINGDSPYWVPQLLNAVEEACVFWLQGPYVLQELQSVLRKSYEHVIFVEASEPEIELAIVLLAEAMELNYMPSDYFVKDGVLCVVPHYEVVEES